MDRDPLMVMPVWLVMAFPLGVLVVLWALKQAVLMALAIWRHRSLWLGPRPAVLLATSRRVWRKATGAIRR